MDEVRIEDEPKTPIIDTNAEEKSAAHSAIFERDFSRYLNLLGISKEDLGKNVLDLGSGELERFSREASKLGIKVVSLNPKLSSRLDKYRESVRIKGLTPLYGSPSAAEYREKVRMDIEGLPPHQGRSVAALATHLPFNDKSFDSVVSVYTIATYLPRRLYGEVFSEITRVLKSGGKAFIGPIDDDPQRLDFLKSVLGKNDNVSYSTAKTSPTDHYPYHDITRHYTTLTLTKK